MPHFIFATLLALTTVVSLPAAAFDWVTKEVVSQGFEVPGGETRSISLNGNYQIKNLVVQARAAGRDGGILDVMVNGEVKGTIYVPGTDPSYVVTVGEASSNVQFVSRATGAIRVDRIIGTISTTSTYPKQQQSNSVLMPSNELTELAKMGIKSVDTLMTWTTAENNEKYLLPIKIASGRLYAVAGSRGTVSAKTAKAVQSLLGQFELAQPFFDQSLTCNECFNEVVNLISIRERLDKAIQ